MAKPTSIPTWATDAGATSDPGASRQATGFLTGKKAPARWFNWLHHRAAQWFLYLNNLHDEPEFLNKGYAWTGQHGFGASIRVKTNVTLETGEVLYANASGVPTPRIRARMLPIAGVTSNSAGNNIARFLGGYLSFFEAGTVCLPLRLPHGSEIAKLTVGVENRAAIPANFGWKLWKKTADRGVPSGSVASALASHPIALMPAESEAMPAVDLSTVIDNISDIYWLDISGDENVQVHWFEMQYKDPGPRNG